jgi:hypothetical protein
MPDDLARAVDREAKRRGISTSEVVRVALIAHLGIGKGRRELPFANVGHGGGGDVASRIEEILDKEWESDLRRR